MEKKKEEEEEATAEAARVSSLTQWRNVENVECNREKHDVTKWEKWSQCRIKIKKEKADWPSEP